MNAPRRPLDALLAELEARGMRLGLDSLRALLRQLGDPQRDLPVVLVGGTNGKGSTAALLAAMARAAGYRTGLATSPHLERVEERIRIDGRPLATAELAALVGEVADTAVLAGLELPTYFEALTAASLLAFRRQEVELAVVEVGLGGRLDATNVCEPRLSIVTGVDFDHQEILGDTLGDIAREKAGIFRRGRPALAWAVDPEVRESLMGAAALCGARLECVDLTVHTRELGGGSSGLTAEVWTAGRRYRLETPLAGAHQLHNLALAVRAAELLEAEGWNRFCARVVVEGAAAAYWPGRLERAGLPDGGAVLLDAAHNPAGVAALAAHLDRRGETYDLLFGALSGKQVDEMLPLLAPAARRITLTRSPAPRGLDPAALAALIPHHPSVVQEADPQQALEAALAARPSLLVICGSIYLLGPLRRALRERHGAFLPVD